MHFVFAGQQFNISDKGPFDTLFNLFKKLMLISSGDIDQALQWLSELDKQYGITKNMDGYGMGDFIKDLEDKGYIKKDEEGLRANITRKFEAEIRQDAFEEIFKNPPKGQIGEHSSNFVGRGKDIQPETRAFQGNDDLTHLDATGTLLNAFKHSDLDDFSLHQDDLRVHETEVHTSIATVLLIDLSHSMILYGEDRITPAKKVALALSELIMKNYQKDSLDIVAFGNEAWQIEVSDLPYLKVGPYHTNTQAALKLARHILQRKRHASKQVFMITDGKPSCMLENGQLYTNSFGLDRKIVNKVFDEGMACKRDKIQVTTFMIARDPYLQDFVREFTELNSGRAYFASPNHLGKFVLEDYVRNRKKKL